MTMTMTFTPLTPHFAAEVAATLEVLKALHKEPERRWEQWLTHAAAAATASAVTWTVAMMLWAR